MESFKPSVWQLSPTDTFLRDQAWYAKKHPRELAAVLNNLKRFLATLEAAPNSKAIHAGYLHTEGRGILAVDERAGGPGLAATRLYLYSEDTTKTIHLITIGNKDSQPDDVKLCHTFLSELTPPSSLPCPNPKTNPPK